MIHSYDKMYLEPARTVLARMLDFAVYDLKYDISDFYTLFLESKYCNQFENGCSAVLAGKSGVELAYDIIEKCNISPKFTQNRSPEYWAGWALAYYQWYTSLSFKEINDFICVKDVVAMYPKYHEIDIKQFVDALNELYINNHKTTNLKDKRIKANLSQKELANLSGVPIRTIQQYEQGQKNINHASAETVVKLSRILYCDVMDILELVQ